MSLKRYIIFIMMLSFAGLNPVNAEVVPDQISFTASVDLTGKPPSARLIYTTRGSTNLEPRDVSFEFGTTKFLLFGDAGTNNLFLLTDLPALQYFPNDVVIQFDMAGQSTGEGVTLIGEAVIPADQVLAPGIEYYIEAHDSLASTLFYTAGSVGETLPQQDDWTFIPISNSITATITPAGGTIVFPDPNPRDGEVQMVFPAGAVENEVEISMQRDQQFLSLQTINLNNPLVTYTIKPDHFTLKKGVQVSFLYPDIDEPAGIVEGTELDEKNLAVFWNDGFEWRSLGGTVNAEDNLINLSLGHFSQYGIFPAALLSSDQYRPKERIITPATIDGMNDIAQFDNLSGRTDITIKFFDITGRKIRDLSSPYTWDGKDDDGDIVETGVYIYQFNVDGTLISGTIAVAK